MNKKNITILGSTGSIGTQSLSIIRNNKDINVSALTCGRNIELLEKQAREFKPKLVVVSDYKSALSIKQSLKDTEVKVNYGMEGLIEAATLEETQLVLTAIVGMVGILPTISAINAGKNIALANKETLVCAGEIIMNLARKKGVSILPVDSEHSAVFQSLQGNEGNRLKKIILTASGGPFFGKTKEELHSVTLDEALNHPNWSMGKKITIDSATMINKGLEVIEACHLFNVSPSKIEVLIHRESILHSAVEYEDGAVMGQLGVPDMRVPIAYAMFYPERRVIGDNFLSLSDITSLTFKQPDLDTFVGLKLCIEAIERGGNVPAIVNAANEIAVERFLNNQIGFLDIPEFIQSRMDSIAYKENPEIEDILDIYEMVK